MAKVLIVNSSPRNNSNSAALAAQVAAGAEEAGHSLSFIDAAKLDIKPCKGCCACITPRSKGCVQRDGMYNEAYPLAREADVIIFASPVYWFNLSGQIKIFIDRLMAVAAPMDENGKRLFASKKLGLVMAYAGDDPFDSGGVNAIRSLQDTCFYTGAAWAGAIYGSAGEPGEIKKNEALLAQARAFGKGL